MAEKVYGYYPGCSLEATAKEYDLSVRAVFEKLGIEIKELEDWSCCGATPAHTVDHTFSTALAARNLSIAEKMGFKTLIVPCPACLIALKKAHFYMKKKEFKDKVNEILEEPYNGNVEIKSALQFIYEDIGLERIKEHVKFVFPEMKVAPYYGCLYTRPPKIANFDDPENPSSMDELLRAAAFEVCDFQFKTECCGAAFGLVKEDMVNTLSYKILSMVLDCKANCVATACPLCQQNLDLRQEDIKKKHSLDSEIPIFYFTQLLGLSFGLPEERLGIEKLIVDGKFLLKGRKEKE